MPNADLGLLIPTYVFATPVLAKSTDLSMEEEPFPTLSLLKT
jgi:hypothetical protein